MHTYCVVYVSFYVEYCKIIFPDVYLLTIFFPDCGILPAVTNGTVDQSGGTEYQDTTLFTCDLGFNLQGTSVRTCGPDGTWDNAQPTCEIAGTDVSFSVGYYSHVIQYISIFLIFHKHV